jgi:hypothetical protein
MKKFKSEKCGISISQNLEESQKEINNIYIDENKISIPFQENSPSPFVSPELRTSDIFYVTEKKDINKGNFPSIGINVEATNLTVSKPVFKINDISNGNDNNTQTNSIEIEYNCEKNIMGETNIKLTFNPENCNPFQLIWVKKCVGELYGKNPNINLEIISNSNQPELTINNGIIEDNYFYLFNPVDSQNQNKEFIVYSNNLIISIQKNNINDDINLLPIEIHPLTNEIIKIKIIGDLGNKGGKINEFKDNINIAFDCNMNNLKNDYSNNYDIVLPFSDGRKITLYFKKICPLPTISVYKKIFNFIYLSTIVYIILTIIFCVFLYYISTDEDFGFKDFIFSLKEKIINPILSKFNLYSSDNFSSEDKEEKSNLKNDETPMENGDEEDIFSIKYTIDKKDNNSNNQNEDYGGI